MMRRVRDAALLNLTVACGHHLLVASCRLYLARHGLRQRPV